MDKYFLGIDNGGTVCKAGVYRSEGTVMSIAGRKVEIFYPEHGHTEKDMSAFRESNIAVMREALEASGVSADDIAGISQTGYGNGLYLAGYDGELVYNGIMSTDSRAESYIEKWHKDGTFNKINDKTLQSLWAGQPVALLRWFKDHKPEIIEKTKWIFMCKDYVRFLLTGEAYSEITDYSGTCLLNQKTGQFDLELLEEFGLSDIYEKLPPLRRSTDNCGFLITDVAKETGLKEGTPVAAGLFDIHACAIATGLTSEKALTVIAGTWSINEYISRAPVGTHEIFMNSTYCLPGYWLVTEASPTSASNLEWFMKNLLESDDYEYASRLVDSVRPEDSELIFFPFIFKSNIATEMTSSFIGLKGWHARPHLLRAVFEGVVFGHKLHIDKLLKYRDKPEIIKISGGASKSDVWVQMFADILDIPVQITSAEELGTLGAAMTAAVGSGFYTSLYEAAESMVKISKTFYPDSSHTRIYNHKFKLFMKYLEAVGSV